jgi:hypothetical protein
VGNLIVALRQDLLWWYLAIAAVIGLLTGLRNAFRSARQADRWDEPTFGWAMLQLLLSLVQALGWPLAPAVWLVVRRAKRARERRLAAEESARRERVIDALLHEVQ